MNTFAWSQFVVKKKQSPKKQKKKPTRIKFGYCPDLALTIAGQSRLGKDPRWIFDFLGGDSGVSAMVSGDLGVSGSSSLCWTFEGFDELLWGGVVALGGSVFAVKLGVSVGLGLCSLCMAPISSSFGYLARIRSSFSLSRLADFVRLGQSRIWLFRIWLVLLKDQGVGQGGSRAKTPH